jgi:acetyl esterase/lipase
MKNYIFLSFILFLIGVQPLVAQEAKYAIDENIRYTSDASEYAQERCKLDIYYPENKTDFTTVVWFHGGGITGGNKFIPEKLKEQGIAVVAVNYRLSPKVKCPVYIEVAWTFKNIEKYGGSKDKIVVSGHSAGGYLTSMVGLDKHYLAAHDINADDIAMLIPFSGHTITHFTIRDEKGIPGTQAIVDEYAPLYFVRPDAPPTIFITGDRELEMLGRYEENAYMWRMMKVAGHKNCKLMELDGFNHGEMASPALEILLKEIKVLDK